jgi:hypothetical protein
MQAPGKLHDKTPKQKGLVDRKPCFDRSIPALQSHDLF